MKTSSLPKIVLVLVAAVSMVVANVQPAVALSGSDWRPARIMDDAIFYNKSSMTVAQIQQYLNAKMPTCDNWGTEPYAGTTRRAYSEARGITFPLTCLRDYHENTSNHQNNLEGRSIPAGAKSAANIIWDAAQEHNINPQVLIVMLQKEQGLVLDEWPWPIQYRSATGYGCPDTADCDSDYYGFYNQVNTTALQFRRYATNPNGYNHAPGRVNSVRWSPNASCGSSNVFIENQATASLYNYTPYQPNQAALNNLYGTGDGCSAYGNRNFWRDFNVWFGTSFGDGFVLAISDDPGDLRQWVLYGTIKQYVPDSQTKFAWNLQNAELVTMSAATLNAISTGPPLDRLARYNNGPIYFIDGGKRYKVPWETLLDTWNLRGLAISSVSFGLFTQTVDTGDLSFSIKDPGSSTIYMPEGANGSAQTILRPYSSAAVREAWEGTTRYTEVSSDYWDAINNAIGSALTSTKITHGGSQWEVTATYRLALDAYTSSLYPGTAQSVSTVTLNRLIPAGDASYLIRSTAGGSIYLLDGGVRHPIPSSDLFGAWTSGARVVAFNPSFISLITEGTAVDDYLVTAGGNAYLIMGGKKLPVPASLLSAYTNALPATAVSTNLVAAMPSGPAPTGFLKGVNTPQVYLLDNSGYRRHLEWADKVSSWGGYAAGITTLPDALLTSVASAVSPITIVTDGTTDYLMDDGKKFVISGSVKSAWGLSTFSPQAYSDGTLSRFEDGGNLETKFRIGGGYFVIAGGVSHGTGDPLIAESWGIENPPVYTQGVFTILRNFMLTRYVRSSVPGDSRIFLVDKGQWYNLSVAHQSNLNISTQPIATMDPSDAPNVITDWPGVVIKDGSNRHYVIDGGRRRFFPHQMIQDQWTNFGQIAIPSVSNGLIQSLPLAGHIERAIKGSAPQVYSADAGTKRHILYPNTYHLYYSPYIDVSDALIGAMPTGTPIP